MSAGLPAALRRSYTKRRPRRLPTACGALSLDVKLRTDLLMDGLDKFARVIEIGPSFAPLAPKRDGWNAFVVDHMSKEGLIQAYSSHPVDVSRIEDVDLVWTGGDLSSVIPQELLGTFDCFIASHVIEHAPDLVSFLQSAERVLKPDGIIILAVPDKRACFDYFRSVSSLADVYLAHVEKRSRHTAKTFFECDAYTVFKLNHPGWYRTSTEPVGFDRSISDAVDAARRADAPEYIDAHAWTFTPSSFQLIALELNQLGLLSYTVERAAVSEHTEFFVWMRRSEARQTRTLPEINTERLRHCNGVLLDLEEQAIQVPGNRQAQLTAELAAAQARIAALEGENQRLRTLGVIAA